MSAIIVSSKDSTVCGIPVSISKIVGDPTVILGGTGGYVKATKVSPSARMFEGALIKPGVFNDGGRADKFATFKISPDIEE